MVKNTFHAADYVIFGLMLLISAAIGIYYALVGGKQRSTREFLMADKNMRSFPVAISVLASFFSASTLLGTPAEIYEYGSQYWISVFGAMLAPLTGALLFGPMFFKLEIVSVYEYLELRFHSKSVRWFGAILFLLRAIMGMGIVLYGPSTALNAVTGFPTWTIILVVGGVCTFYTTLGGMKAVIWTDVFQTLVMLCGMLAVFIEGTIRVGGPTDMWDINHGGGRINFFNFDTDPHIRQTFWALTVGIYFVWLYPYTVDQQMVQRFSCSRSLKDARFALLLNVPGMFILITLCSLTGLALYANYATCDPLTNGDISDVNQLLPFFVLEIFKGFPGLSGLFVACIFSGALSSISSMLNSLTAVTWEDFLKVFLGTRLSETQATLLTKCLAVLYGALGIGMAFAVEKMGGTVLQASLTFNGSAGAPLVGMFILGACFTSANWIGTLSGGVLGFVAAMWGGIGKYVLHQPNFKLPVTALGCNSTNTTVLSLLEQADNVTSKRFSDLEGLNQFYGISYLWFSAIGVLTSIVMGLLISILSGGNQYKVADNLQLHVFENIFACICDIPGYKRKTHENTTLQEYLDTIPSYEEYINSIPIKEKSIDLNDETLLTKTGSEGNVGSRTNDNVNERDTEKQSHHLQDLS